MPWNLTDLVVTFDDDGDPVPVVGQTVTMFPNIDLLDGFFVFVGSTWYEVQHPGTRTATTDINGAYTFADLPLTSEQDPTTVTWTLQLHDGTQAVGAPPAAGTYSLHDLVTDEDWELQ